MDIAGRIGPIAFVVGCTAATNGESKAVSPPAGAGSATTVHMGSMGIMGGMGSDGNVRRVGRILSRRGGLTDGVERTEVRRRRAAP